MPYLQTILDAEEKARTIRECAERETMEMVSEKRMKVAERFESHKAKLDRERDESLAAQKAALDREYNAALADARSEAGLLAERVRPRESNAVAKIRTRILNR